MLRELNMCLILLAWRAHPDYPLILAANRDEFFSRPTQIAGPWPEAPGTIAGRDLEKGGTWLAVSARGRLAAVTNYRDGTEPRSGTRSRGLLVSEFVVSDLGPAPFLSRVREEDESYQGFNLLVAADGVLLHYAKPGHCLTRVAPGIHGLSNHLLDTPWPKVERGKAALHLLLGTSGEPLIDGLFHALGDTYLPPDDALPRTGVGVERERLLSTAFIAAPDYGTRASTVVLVESSGAITFVERNFGPESRPLETRRFRITPQVSALPRA